MALTLVVDPAIVKEYPSLARSLGGVPLATVNGPATSYGHAIPAAGYFAVRDCGGSLTFFDGPLTQAQVAAIAPCPADANRDTLRTRAAAALATNATFLAIVSPTQGQAVAQVQALTRQVDGIIRLLLDQTDTISDS